MYNDLPPINVIHEEPSGLSEGQWSVSLRYQHLERHGCLEPFPSWSNDGAQQIPAMYTSAHRNHSKVSSWLPSDSKSGVKSSRYPIPYGDLGVPAWRSRSVSLAHIQGITEEIFGSDQTSSGGSWSPEDSEGYSRCDVIEDEPLTRPEKEAGTLTSWSREVSCEAYVYPSPSLTGGGEGPDPGVTLQDVQQFPDHCATDSGDEHMSLADSEDHDMLIRCSSGGTNNMMTTEIVSPSTKLNKIPIGTSYVGRNRNPKEDLAIRTTESDSSEYQNRSKKGSKRCTIRRIKSSRTLNQREALKAFSKTKVSKYRSRKFPKHTTNIASTKDEPLGSRCNDCEFETTSKSTLRKHALTVHIRPFTCSFRIYGCSATFGSKNEWKRHVSSQHLRLGFWRCDLNGCLPTNASLGKASDSAYDLHRACSEEAVTYNDFNRKDLFTQHLRRMHAPGRGASKADREAFDYTLSEICTRCWISTRKPPAFRTCGFCEQDSSLNGDDFGKIVTWEARMEHVGRHLEIGHGKSRVWREDSVLRDWMIENGLIEQGKNGAWTLSSLQRGRSKSTRNTS